MCRRFCGNYHVHLNLCNYCLLKFSCFELIDQLVCFHYQRFCRLSSIALNSPTHTRRLIEMHSSVKFPILAQKFLASNHDTSSTTSGIIGTIWNGFGAKMPLRSLSMTSPPVCVGSSWPGRWCCYCALRAISVRHSVCSCGRALHEDSRRERTVTRPLLRSWDEWLAGCLIHAESVSKGAKAVPPSVGVLVGASTLNSLDGNFIHKYWRARDIQSTMLSHYGPASAAPYFPEWKKISISFS